MGRDLSRRQFLQHSLLLGASGLAATLPLGGCWPTDTLGPEGGLKSLSPRQWQTLDLAGRVLWPATPGHPGAGEAGAALLADALVARSHPAVQALLKQLLDGVADFPLLAGYFQSFSAMDAATRLAYLHAWRDGPLAVQRQGYVALARLTGSLTYMAPITWPGICYPGPWVGRIDVGTGLDGQGNMATNPNPHVFSRFGAG